MQSIGKVLNAHIITVCCGILLLLGQGCAGYAFKRQNNPFDHYGIRSKKLGSEVGTDLGSDLGTDLGSEVVSAEAGMPEDMDGIWKGG